MFKSTEIKKAWQIRKSAAAKFGVNVIVIRWSECLRLAKMASLDTKVVIAKLDYAGNPVFENAEWQKDSQGTSYKPEGRGAWNDMGKCALYKKDTFGSDTREDLTVSYLDFVAQYRALEKAWKASHQSQKAVKITDEKKMFGWCDKCQSYCFGDCQAN